MKSITLPGARGLIKQAFLDGETTTNPKGCYESKGESHQGFSHVVLGLLLRDFFIKKVLGLVALRVPEVIKKNTNYQGTHVLVDIFYKFFTCKIRKHLRIF